MQWSFDDASPVVKGVVTRWSGVPAAASGDKAYVDALFAFTQTLAYDYSGAWNAGHTDGDAVFTITILQATCPGCTPFPGVATVKPTDTAAIRTRAASSPRAVASSAPLTGDYGKTRGPEIVSFVADDFDNGDGVYGSGDTLTVTFDLATDRGGTDVRAISVDVDDMLEFSQVRAWHARARAPCTCDDAHPLTCPSAACSRPRSRSARRSSRSGPTTRRS